MKKSLLEELFLRHIEDALDETNPRSLTNQAAQTDQRITELDGKLQEPARKYERYLRDKAEWERKQRDAVARVRAGEDGA